jgi:osmotically-inducible protein OsmY
MARNDELIKNDIVDSLYWDARVDASDIAVQVHEGAVTLSGTVPTYRSREAAFEDAWTIRDVMQVENRIDVLFPAAVTVPGDHEIRHHVETVLGFDPDIVAGDIDIRVEDGIVTLHGSVDTFWKKVHAASLATQVRGVRKVEDKLTIVPTHDVLDETIADDVEAAIDRNILVNAEDVNVRVQDGVVTLTGTVPTWAAHQAALDAARFTSGVTGVRSELTVQAEAFASRG